jgi:hypothetical protein
MSAGGMVTFQPGEVWLDQSTGEFIRVEPERVAALRIIAGLMSDEGENVEYDRACVEIARDLLRLDWEDDTRAKVAAILRRLR